MPSPPRIEQLTPAVQVSPTGQPMVPTWLGPVAAALGAVALSVTQLVPPDSAAYRVAQIVIGVCAVFGPVSAGWRK